MARRTQEQRARALRLALRLALEARDPVAMMAIARPARHSFEKMFTMRS